MVNGLVHKYLLLEFPIMPGRFVVHFDRFKQMLEKVYCSYIAPSLSSRNHLFYKAEYMGQSLIPELGGVHQRPEISISELHFESPFQEYLFQVASALQSKVMAQT